MVHGGGSVKLWTASKRQRHTYKVTAVWVMLVLWLGTFSLVVFPQLHRWLHEDAGSPNHTCLVSQLRHNPSLVGLAAPVAPAPVVAYAAALPLPNFQVIPIGDYRLTPSRAPPLISSISVA
jgi:hypothetical protein